MGGVDVDGWVGDLGDQVLTVWVLSSQHSAYYQQGQADGAELHWWLLLAQTVWCLDCSIVDPALIMRDKSCWVMQSLLCLDGGQLS